MTMKNNILMMALGTLLVFQHAEAAEKKIIRISTDQTDLVLQVAENGRLYQTYLGEKLLHEAELETLTGGYILLRMRVSPLADGRCIRAQEMKTSLSRLWVLHMLMGIRLRGCIMCPLLQKSGWRNTDRYSVA